MCSVCLRDKVPSIELNKLMIELVTEFVQRKQLRWLDDGEWVKRSTLLGGVSDR